MERKLKIKNPEDVPQSGEEPESMEEDRAYTSCTAHDYSPSNPWDAPGMSVRDFI